MSQRNKQLQQYRALAMEWTMHGPSICHVDLMSVLASMFNEAVYSVRWPSFVQSTLELIDTSTNLFSITQHNSANIFQLPKSTRKRLKEYYKGINIPQRFDKRLMRRLGTMIINTTKTQKPKLSTTDIWLGILIDTMPEVGALIPSLDQQYFMYIDNRPFLIVDTKKYGIFVVQRIDRFLQLPATDRETIDIFKHEINYAIKTYRH